MDHTEFAKVMAVLSAGCGKALTAEATEVYYELLGPLPIEALRAAVVMALRANTFSVFPQIGTLWQAANLFLRRQRLAIEAAERRPFLFQDAYARKCFAQLANRWKSIAIAEKLGPGRLEKRPLKLIEGPTDEEKP